MTAIQTEKAVPATILDGPIVLDKSYLQGVSGAQFVYLCSRNLVVVPDVLVFELLKGTDVERTQSLEKLYRVQDSIVFAPGVPELMRAESSFRKPSNPVAFKRLRITAKESSGVTCFRLSPWERRAIQQHVESHETSLPDIVAMWRAVEGYFPQLRSAMPANIAGLISSIEAEISNNESTVRQLYSTMRHKSHPPSEMISGDWVFYRWVQIHVLAAIDHIRKYGFANEPNREKLLHERLDIDYTITAALVGGLASNDRTIRNRFRILRHDGRIIGSR